MKGCLATLGHKLLGLPRGVDAAPPITYDTVQRIKHQRIERLADSAPLCLVLIAAAWAAWKISPGIGAIPLAILFLFDAVLTSVLTVMYVDGRT
jgi:hypothetical protein